VNVTMKKECFNQAYTGTECFRADHSGIGCLRADHLVTECLKTTAPKKKDIKRRFHGKPSFKIGSFTPETSFMLAPLAGITDRAMRRLCREQGASLVCTEMVSAKGLWYGDRKSRKLLELGDDEDAAAFQVFGSDPEVLSFAAKTLRDEKNVILDLNVGCPVPKIVKNGEGAALLKNQQRLFDIVSAMVKEAVKPVTAKIRMGFERGTDIAVETAKLLEAAGAAAVMVHGRTREQYYEGKADWQAIADVKRNVNIPVIGNGDVFSGQDAVDMLHQTGCDGVMIARGAMGNPWIFRDAAAIWRGDEKPESPSDRERIEMLIRHFHLVIEDKGERVAVREIRKHIGWYVKGMHGAAAMRRKTNNITDVHEMERTIREMLR